MCITFRNMDHHIQFKQCPRHFLNFPYLLTDTWANKPILVLKVKSYMHTMTLFHWKSNEQHHGNVITHWSHHKWIYRFTTIWKNLFQQLQNGHLCQHDLLHWTEIFLEKSSFLKQKQHKNSLKSTVTDSYPFIDEITKVQIWTKESSNKRIQLIGMRKSPVLVILNFDSSK